MDSDLQVLSKLPAFALQGQAESGKKASSTRTILFPRIQVRGDSKPYESDDIRRKLLREDIVGGCKGGDSVLLEQGLEPEAGFSGQRSSCRATRYRAHWAPPSRSRAKLAPYS